MNEHLTSIKKLSSVLGVERREWGFEWMHSLGSGMMLMRMRMV